MEFTLPYPPSANRYWRYNRGQIHVSEEARDFKREAAWMAVLAGVECLEGNVKITLRVYRPARRGDLDNSIKVLIDALRGIVYNDDDQIVELHALRFDDKTDPRVVVKLESL